MPRKKIPVVHTDENGTERRYDSVLMATICTGLKDYTIRKYADSEINGWKYAKDANHEKEYKVRRKVIKADPVSGEKVDEYVSIQHAADLNGATNKIISDSCKFKDRLCNGYVYLYKDEYSSYEVKYVYYKAQSSIETRKKERIKKMADK